MEFCLGRRFCLGVASLLLFACTTRQEKTPPPAEEENVELLLLDEPSSLELMGPDDLLPSPLPLLPNLDFSDASPCSICRVEELAQDPLSSFLYVFHPDDNSRIFVQNFTHRLLLSSLRWVVVEKAAVLAAPLAGAKVLDELALGQEVIVQAIEDGYAKIAEGAYIALSDLGTRNK